VRGKPPQAGPSKDRRATSVVHRRIEEQTKAWRDRYRRRAGIEGTNSGLKRRMELSRLRVRGCKSVFNVTMLKITGWNIFRAVSGLSHMTKKTAKATKRLLERPLFPDQVGMGVVNIA